MQVSITYDIIGILNQINPHTVDWQGNEGCKRYAYEILDKFSREQGFEIHRYYTQTEAGDNISHTMIDESDFNLFMIVHPGLWKEDSYDW